MQADKYQKIYVYKRIVAAKLFIDTNFADKLDVNNIADEAHFSKFHFIRLFRSIYGKTPYHYLTQVRIDHAKKLLIQNHPVSDVCIAVGFNSVTSFSALFKTIVGSAPSAFQHQQQKRRIEIASAPLKFIPNCFAESHGWTKKIAILDK